MAQRVALVTGASTGIGHEAAIRLAQAGFAVYAGARRLAGEDGTAESPWRAGTGAGRDP